MNIPAYAKSRIDYLTTRYESIPQIVYFSSRRESARAEYKDTAIAAKLIGEARNISWSYLCPIKSKYEFISKPLLDRQKDAIDRAIKQLESTK
tara:strand:+ start:7997 stop:8275 length:279 start_codon:yes stop_codon:yes gene_type:complete